MNNELLVIGINGSLNKDGRGAGFLRTALSEAEREGAATRLVHLVDKEDVIPLLKQADGIIFSTPVHWFNVSTLMKEFLDSLTPLEYPDFPLEGKVAGFIATCEEDGGMQAIQAMVGVTSHLGMIIPPYATVFVNLNMVDKSEGEWMRKDVELLGVNMVRMIRKAKGESWGY